MMIIAKDLDRFDHEGSRIPSYPLESSTCNKSSQNDEKVLPIPPWFDKERFEQCRTITNQYFMSIFFCHLSGLILLVYIRSIYNTLSATGKSANLVSIFYRYMHTVLHVKRWYEGKVYDCNDPAYHSLLSVKQMHQNVAEVQNKDKIVKKDELALSQRDMALTQFSFIGLIILNPKKMGFPQDPVEIEKLIYFWRCIGYMLGVEDEYNLCAGDYRQVRKTCQLMFDHHFKHKLIEQAKDSYQMGWKILFTANQYIVMLRYNGMLCYLFEVLNLFTFSRTIKLSFSEKMFYYALKWFVGTLAHYKLWAILLNNLLRYAFYRLSHKHCVKSIVCNLEQHQSSNSELSCLRE